MYHSVTFGDKNTWDDWCLIPETEPIIVPPTQKTNFLDVPGADGSLDMSKALTGYPIYNNREGSLTFIAMNDKAALIPECDPLKLRQIASNIMNYLHGRTMKMVLEDDRAYYYEGRFAVEEITPENDFSKITISYSVKPYKMTVLGSIDNWIWDTFNFQTGIITSEFADIPVTTEWNSMNLKDSTIGKAPIVPEFTVSSLNGQGVYIRFVNKTLEIDETKLFQNGTRIDEDFIMYGDEVTIYYRVSSSTGTLTINYRQGRL